MTTVTTAKQSPLFSGPEFIAASQHPDRLAWAFEQTLMGTKSKRFLSAALLEASPRTAVILYPVRVKVATQIFEKPYTADEMSRYIGILVQTLLGGAPLKYVPHSEGRKELGWEVCLDHKHHLTKMDDDWLPVAIVHACMCSS